MKLLTALLDRFPDGIDYAEAAQLAVSIHGIRNALPSDCAEAAGDRKEIASAFAGLSHFGRIRFPPESRDISARASDAAHWADLIRSLYLGQWQPDHGIREKFPDLFI